MEHIEQLLRYGKVLTIARQHDGTLMISLADVETSDDDLWFSPEQIMFSSSTLIDAIVSFYEHQEMIRVQGYNA